MADPRTAVLLAVGAMALLFGLLPLWWLLKRAGRRLANQPQPSLSGGTHLIAFIASLLLLAVGVSALWLVAMLSSWSAFTKKTHVAELQCIELGPHKLRVYFVPIESDGVRGKTETYDLDGDQWQVGGDVLRFRPILTALGVQAVYRINRVEGHWNSAADANHHLATAFDRGGGPSSGWLALYRDADRAPLRWLVAGAHGQSVSQLPDRRSVYDLFVTANGLIVDKRSL
jgi:hypothetical protein